MDKLRSRRGTNRKNTWIIIWKHKLIHNQIEETNKSNNATRKWSNYFSRLFSSLVNKNLQHYTNSSSIQIISPSHVRYISLSYKPQISRKKPELHQYRPSGNQKTFLLNLYHYRQTHIPCDPKSKNILKINRKWIISLEIK